MYGKDAKDSSQVDWTQLETLNQYQTLQTLSVAIVKDLISAITPIKGFSQMMIHSIPAEGHRLRRVVHNCNELVKQMPKLLAVTWPKVDQNPYVAQVAVRNFGLSLIKSQSLFSDIERVLWEIPDIIRLENSERFLIMSSETYRSIRLLQSLVELCAEVFPSLDQEVNTGDGTTA